MEIYRSLWPPTPARGNAPRVERYTDLAFAPGGPLRNDLGLRLEDVFWEPFDQLLRQQMLAFKMQRAREDGADRVRVLHLSPRDNRALHEVTAPALRRLGDDAFEVSRAILADPDTFVHRTPDAVFAGLVTAEATDGEGCDWADYLKARYADLLRSPSPRLEPVLWQEPCRPARIIRSRKGEKPRNSAGAPAK